MSTRAMRLLLASNNAKKLGELERLFEGLEGLAVQIVLPREVGGVPDVVEDAPTFAGNAAKKARSAALAKGMWTLADDSGLSVDALGGAPGVRSARYAGAHGDDGANNAKVLAELAGVPDFLRGAHFTCALALARPDGTIAAEIEGRTHGRILHAPRGTHDFGYDPLFELTEPGFAVTGRAFAEIGPDEKGSVSHRGRALRELLARLPSIVREA